MYSTLDITLTVFFVIFVLVDIVLNVVLVLAIHRKKSLQTPMNLLILHLAITDVLVGMFIIPRHILSYAITYPRNKASDYICQLVTGGNFIWTSVTASSGFLTIIALERLFAVVYPHKAKLRVTRRRLKWLVWACWLSSLAFNLPSLLVLKYDHENHFCMENWPEWANPKAYVGFAFFAGNFSVIAMYILYSAILLNLWKKHKAVSEVSRAARINARKRVTRMLILMTVVHTICRTPNYTFYMLSYFDPGAKYGSTVYSFTVFLILLNSASHPFFFCWYMTNLRREVFAVLPLCFLGHCPARVKKFTLSSAESGSESAARKESHKMRDVHSSDFASNSYDEKKKNSLKRKYILEHKENYGVSSDHEDRVTAKMDKKDPEEPHTEEDLIISNEDIPEVKLEKNEVDNHDVSEDVNSITSSDVNSDEAKEVDKIEKNKRALESELAENVAKEGEADSNATFTEVVIFSMEPIQV